MQAEQIKKKELYNQVFLEQLKSKGSQEKQKDIPHNIKIAVESNLRICNQMDRTLLKWSDQSKKLAKNVKTLIKRN